METALIAIGTLVPLLLILVVVHELGHFFTARALGVKVLEFGVGFPPRAFGVYTGKTRVLFDPFTRFINLQGPADLKRGQLIKVYSTEDPQGNLVARYIEVPQRKRRFKGQDAQDSQDQPPEIPDDLLKHEGKVRSVEADGGSILLSDMLYSVNWAPLGGFVRLAGESNPDVPRSLAGKGVGTRFVVLVAGPLMNVVLPIVVFAILFMVPQDVTIGRVTATQIRADSPAAEAGLQPGDVIVRAGGHKVEGTFDLTRAINLNGGGTMDWLIERGGNQEVIRVKPRFESPPGRWFAGIGVGQDPGQVVVERVLADSAAEAAGFRQGDILLRAGNQVIEQPSDLTASIQSSQGTPMEWRIIREGREQVISMTPRFEQSGAARWLTGISISLADRREVSRSQPPWEAIPQGFVSTWEALLLMKQSITGSISGGATPELSGPIGIAQLTGEVTREGGLTGWLAIGVLLSINLAILNILPIPMLDGGRLAFVFLEWVRRGKKVPPEKEGLVHLAGFALLISAILVISANDIYRIIQGGSLLGG